MEVKPLPRRKGAPALLQVFFGFLGLHLKIVTAKILIRPVTMVIKQLIVNISARIVNLYKNHMKSDHKQSVNRGEPFIIIII
jgi:hypothetical protein